MAAQQALQQQSAPLPPQPQAASALLRHLPHPSAWLYLAYFILALSILQGIRYPTQYIYAHFLFNYDFGFMRRGLIGAFWTWLDNPYFRSYEFCLIFWLTLFVICMVLMARMLKVFVGSKNLELTACALVFASSLAVVYAANTYGYSDRIGLLVTLVAFYIRGFYRKLIYCIVTVPLCLLVHEAFLIIFFPVIFMMLVFCILQEQREEAASAQPASGLLRAFAIGTMAIAIAVLFFLISKVLLVVSFILAFVLFLFNILQERQDIESSKVQQHTKHKAILLAVFSIFALGLTYAILLHSAQFDKETADAMHKAYTEEVGFETDRIIFTWTLQWSMAENLNARINLFEHIRASTRAVILSIIIISPVAYLFIHTALKLANNIPLYQKVLMVLACLSPLLLHIIGYDVHRWNALVVMVSFLMLYLAYQFNIHPLSQCTPLPRINFGRWVFPLAVLGIYLGGVIGVPMITGRGLTRDFMLLEYWDYVRQLLSGEAQFPTQPPY